jgi:tRNA-Thr(GGU) m(6)t(6)A37 methyltransferase TsaA
MDILYHPIGTVHSPFRDIAGMPIQPTAAEGIAGRIELSPEYREGLKDVDGFSHIIVIYHLHRAAGAVLTVTPFLDSRPRGVFATRAPTRPNPIGLSVLKLLRVEGSVLHVENVDILDGTPVLDLKPYVPEFDHPEEIRTGWLEKARKKVRSKRSDDRFR